MLLARQLQELLMARWGQLLLQALRDRHDNQHPDS
jgi:hypothetical protein